MGSWGFLTNHAHVLIQIVRDSRATVREIAVATGITERAAINVLHDLRRSGVIAAERQGRQNVHYIDVPALASHRPWSATRLGVPEELIQATLRGLAQLAGPGIQKMPHGLKAGQATPGSNHRRWGFLTTHAVCLIFVTQNPRATVREIALAIGITERAAHSVLRDLRDAGIIECERFGRRNSYTVSFEHLSGFRREGTAPGLVPDSFVSSLVGALLPLQPLDYPPEEALAHPIV